MKKRAFFLLLLLLIPLTSILSQEIALKTNALSWATTTINLGDKPGSRIQNITPTDSRGRYHV